MNEFVTFFVGCDWVGWGHVVSCLCSTTSTYVISSGRCLSSFSGVRLSWRMYFGLVIGVFWGSHILERGFVGFGS